MNKEIRFTFVLPVHNGGRYIKEQIESILHQEYKNFNLIVLENFSDDGTVDYLKTINDSRMEVIPSEQLLSFEENWARIIDTERADYTIIAMADDKYETNYLSEIVKLIKKYPNKNVYRTNVKFFNENSEVIGQSNIKETINFYEYLKGRLNHTYFETFQGYCFDTNFYNKIGGFECKFKGMYMDDKIVLTAIEGNFMPVSSQYACFYRMHSASVSGSPNFEADIQGFNYIFNWLYEKNDKKILNIIRDSLPNHIQAFSHFYTDEQVLEYKKIYKLFDINTNSIIYRIKRWLKKHFYIKKECGQLKIRLLFIKIRKNLKLNIKKKTLLICRFDGIGDYLIMRKYLKNIRYSEKYKDYYIIFAGRNEFSEFAEKYDKKYIDKFIWVNYSEYMSNKNVRKEYYKLFSKLNVNEVISPVYDREPIVCEPIVGSVKAEIKYGHSGPMNRFENVISEHKIKKYNKIYTKLIFTGDDIVFEEERYRRFFEQIIKEPIEDNNLDSIFSVDIDFNSKYVLIAPFAGDVIRTWNKFNFVDLINFLVNEYNYDVGILGSNNINEEKIADEMICLADKKSKVKNLVGKISLAELPIYLKKCQFLVANETGTVHLAHAINTKTYCISNGSYMNRFMPYKNINYIYPDNIINYLKEHHEIGLRASVDINSIKSKKVIDIIKGDIINER